MMSPFAYDIQIAQIAAQKTGCIADVIAALQAIETLLPDNDGLKWFNWLYRQVTLAVNDSLHAGAHSSPRFIAFLDVNFAQLYLNALSSWIARRGAPHCWSVLFERRSQAAVARIQFALAGIHAHINHDLPQAVVETCEAIGDAPAHSSPEYSDYTGLNGPIGSLIDNARDELMVRLPGDDLPAGHNIEILIASWSLSMAREVAWTNSEVLWALRGADPVYRAQLGVLDRTTELSSTVLLTPAT